jgi:hypothetical protein
MKTRAQPPSGNIAGLMDIREATRAYEQWLAGHVRLLRDDLRLKHVAMAKGAFPFLRATFYRWSQIWPRLCPALAKAPVVLGVGDLHLENFGTWRDTEGRLIWGVNDFDEAHPMPYPLDLVRLATSALIALGEDHLSCKSGRACNAILDGYLEGLRKDAEPFVLAERNRWLRRLAHNELREPVRFWRKLESMGALSKLPPSQVISALAETLPHRTRQCTLLHRQAGLGSLGRERATLIGNCRGSLVAREAKTLAPSAWLWAGNGTETKKLWYEVIAKKAIRVPDPCLRLCGHWVLRRLAPDCSRIELSDLPRQRDELRLLWAMGKETANIHQGSRTALRQVKKHLARQPKRWLREAAEIMAKATYLDWKEWRATYRWRR